MGTMANMFCGPYWEIVFYIILIIYLYGDLAIYAVAVPNSLTLLTQHYLSDDDESKGSDSFENVYYIYLAAFAVLIVPFCFFNFQKTKYLQYTTLTFRNVAMATMIILSIIRMADGKMAKLNNLRYLHFQELPNLFGTVVYAFMCHHSLPSIITPVEDKRNIAMIMAFAYCFVIFVYSTLDYLTVLAFGDPCATCYNGDPCEIQSIITDTFTDFGVKFIAIFLTLYPVFTLSTNYPLIAITLRNNMLNCIPWGSTGRWSKWRPHIFSAIVAIPPILIAFLTRDAYVLVNITGAYGGVGIQWLIPVILIYYSRKKMEEIAPGIRNPHRSMFNHYLWQVAILILVVISVIVSTANLIRSAIQSESHGVTCDEFQ